MPTFNSSYGMHIQNKRFAYCVHEKRILYWCVLGFLAVLVSANCVDFYVVEDKRIYNQNYTYEFVVRIIFDEFHLL